MTRPFVGAVLAGVLLAAPAIAAAPALRNGDFAQGQGTKPQWWREEAWAADKSQMAWGREPDGTGVAIIASAEPNDARWCQAVAVEPGASYRVSARVRTANVGADTAGALIAIEPRVGDSTDLRGTQPWQRLELTADSGERTSFDVCLRLGSYANLNTGTAWFTDVQIEQIGGGAPTRWLPTETFARFRPTMPDMPTSVREAAAPLGGGILVAWAFGIFRRRRVR